MNHSHGKALPASGRTGGGFAAVLRSLARLFSDTLDDSESDATETTFISSPRNAVLVIDVSASMDSIDWSPSRIQAAKEAAMAFTQRLASEEPDAHVAVIPYSSSATIACDLTSVRRLRDIKRAISSLQTKSSTNLTAGLQLAAQVLKGAGANGQVVTLSDGHHNGTTRRKAASAAQHLKQFAIVECVGIGGSPGDVDEELLKAVASRDSDGRKRYRWIGDKEQLVQHFHRLAGRIARA